MSGSHDASAHLSTTAPGVPQTVPYPTQNSNRPGKFRDFSAAAESPAMVADPRPEISSAHEISRASDGSREMNAGSSLSSAAILRASTFDADTSAAW